MAAAVGTNKYGLDAELFTRSDKGAEARGASMVQRHAQQMQKEKEDAAMANLAVLMPEFSEFTRIMALQEAEWNVEGATTLMNQFAAEKGDELKALHKKQKKLHRELSSGQDDTQTVKDKDGGGDASSGSGSSSSGSEDDSEDEGHKKSRRKSSKSSKKKRSKDKDRKKKKKEKGDKGDRDTGGKDKDKALGGGGINPVNFGKYGIIRETDMAAKSSEFTLWAVEVKGIDVTTVGRIEERELFRDYIEDYNTGTFAHRKYYNLEAYERERVARAQRKAEEAAKKGKHKPASQVAKDDEEALKREREAERQRLKNERLMDAYKEMKRTDKAANMKEQEELRLKMNLAYKTGDVDKARKLAERMAPDKEELKRLAEGKMPKRRFKDLQ